MFFGECKYVIKDKRQKHINYYAEIFSDSDEETQMLKKIQMEKNYDSENFDKENSSEEKLFFYICKKMVNE